MITLSKLDNDNLKLFDSTNCESLSINLFDNTINSDIKEYFEDLTSAFGNSLTLVVGRECRKYHFYYTGFVLIDVANWCIEQIILEKYHFIRRRRDGMHFVVNADYIDESTSVRLTFDCKTKELRLPFVDFDLGNVKKIDKRLRNIELLG